MTVNIKYCGGCNPRFDRVELANKLKDDFSDISFVSEVSDNADAMIVLCGCPSACANITDSYASGGRFVLWSEAAYEKLKDFLKNTIRKQTICS